jgi:hypothetical protein
MLTGIANRADCVPDEEEDQPAYSSCWTALSARTVPEIPFGWTKAGAEDWAKDHQLARIACTAAAHCSLVVVSRHPFVLLAATLRSPQLMSFYQLGQVLRFAGASNEAMLQQLLCRGSL